MCHCSQCRKTAGAPFHCVFPVEADGFKLHDEEHLLREFRSSRDKIRTFCGRCGSPIYSLRDNANSFRVRAGLFEHLDSVDWGGHIFVRDAVGWYHEHDELPRYDALEPGRDSAKSKTLLPDDY